MKKPDEIKKGLECCTTKAESGKLKTCDLDCPYHVEGLWCRNALAYDTLAYIQQLEQMLHESLARNAPCMEAAYGLAEKVGKLEAKVPRWISVEERLPEAFVLR